MYSLFSCLRANVFFIHSKIGLISPKTPRHKLNPPANHSTSQKREGGGRKEGVRVEKKKKKNKATAVRVNVHERCELGAQKLRRGKKKFEVRKLMSDGGNAEKGVTDGRGEGQKKIERMD